MNKMRLTISALSILAVSAVSAVALAWGIYGSTAKVCTPAAVYWEADNGGQVVLQCREDSQTYYFMKSSCSNANEHTLDDVKQVMSLANAAFLSGKPLQMLWAGCGLNKVSKLGIFDGV